MLRIEDIDRTRCKPEFEAACLADLRWLGLDWDEGPDTGGPHGPYRQSDRLGLYDAAMERLSAGGHTYACLCSRAQVRAAQRAPHLSRFFADVGRARPYPGTCRPDEGETARRCDADRDLGGWRLDVNRLGQRAVVTLDDRWTGRHTEDVRETCGDFLLGRPGAPTYQLAAVYDDRTMGITDVIRGSDLMGSSARQRLLHRALDETDGALPEPTLAHHPLVIDDRGAKLSKRDRASSLQGLRDDGVPSQRVLAAVAVAVGLAPPSTTALGPRELVERFAAGSPRLDWRDGPLRGPLTGG